MSDEEKAKYDKRLKISRIMLIINFVIAIVNMSYNNKIIKYIYIASIFVLVAGIALLINVIVNRYKKDKTYTMTLLYLGSIFIQFMNIVLKLDSCQSGF